jgi:hypothetical protein
MQVFSRWGELLFESTDPAVGWDGLLSDGSYAKSDAYTWIIQFTDLRGRARQEAGTVFLVY